MSDRVEKRKDVRISFQVPLTVQWRSQESSGSGTVGNMSQSGCYVMTQHPALIFLQPDQNLPELEGLVRHTHEQVGGASARFRIRQIQLEGDNSRTYTWMGLQSGTT